MTLLLVSLILLVSASSAEAVSGFECQATPEKAPSTDLLSAVESRYQKIRDLRADFYQESYFLGLDQRIASRGRVFFKKPGKMDWLYREPEKQRFISNGKTLWFYQPELNQVTVNNFVNSFESELPVSFLLGIGSLKKNFQLTSSCKSDVGTVLHLKPKKTDPTLNQFSLLVRPKDHVPLGAKIVDIGGNETVIRFLHLESNIDIADKQFAFKIPRGVDIIDPRSQAGQISSTLAISESNEKQPADSRSVESN